MESNLLRATKRRVIRELNDTVQNNPVYRDQIKVYHKFPYKERPMRGIILSNSSASRVRLSPDDYAAELKSHVAVARAGNHEGKFLDWVWEDEYSLTVYVKEEDLSSQIPSTGSNRIFQLAHFPVIAGYNNTELADNFRQVDVFVDGQRVFPTTVDAINGKVYLPNAPSYGQEVKISYHYKNIVDPGRYYIQLVTTEQYVIDPLYVVKREKVLESTTGLEMTANLAHGNLIPGLETLFTKKFERSYDLELVKDVDYSIDYASGAITFLSPLPKNTSLYATYRWAGPTMGPYAIPKDYEYDNTSLPGVVLAFGNQKVLSDKLVVIVYPQREQAARVYSGHWNMSFDINIFTRDPMELSDLTDYIIDDMWSRKRLHLIAEGLTIEEMNPGGESEEVYDSNTGDLYYKNSINLNMMTEWKRFVPYLTEIVDFDTKLYSFVKSSQDILLSDGRTFEVQVLPYQKEFEVKYPKAGYPKYT